MIKQEILLLQRELLLKKLRDVGKQMGSVSLKPNKGYTIRIINGKYFVQYIDAETKKYLPLKRCLYTANKEEAEKLAVKYREAFIIDYYRKKSGVKDIYELFSNYYKPDKSLYLQEQLKREERKLSPVIIKKYDGYMNHHWIPFLKENKITRIEEITLDGTIKSFQDYLIKKEISKKTINSNIIDGVIKPVFNTVMKEKSIFNTTQKYNLKGIKQEQTGIPPQTKTLFILNNVDLWKLYRDDKIKNEKTYKKYRLWCLIAATTGLREGEIFYLRKSDRLNIKGVPYLFIDNNDGRNLKTEFSKRKVPLPRITDLAFEEYVMENNIQDYLFCDNSSICIDSKGFMYAFQQLSAHLGFTRKDMIEKRLRFHSLRLFYQTLLNTSELKENIIEYFMGHKVDMASMKERYNNRNDLDDKFFAKFGNTVIDYFNEEINKVSPNSIKNKLANETPITFTKTMKEVEFTDKRKKTQKYITAVIEDNETEDNPYQIFKDGIIDRAKWNKQ
jgi:hypothetical protein